MKKATKDNLLIGVAIVLLAAWAVTAAVLFGMGQARERGTGADGGALTVEVRGG